MHEYTSAVFGVGLDGFAPVDHDRINELAADGWEPVHMASAHNGLAAVVLFRRDVADVVPVTRAASAGRAAPARKATKAKKAATAKKTAARKTVASRTMTRKATASGTAATKRARGR